MVDTHTRGCLHRHTLGLLVFLLVTAITSVTAQQVTFNWTTIPPSIRDELFEVPECGSFSVTLTPTEGGVFGPVPPFYMTAAAYAGPVTLDALQGNEVNGGVLVWDPVKHTAGASVLINIVDSVGNTGDPALIYVTNGTTTDCHIDSRAPNTPVQITVGQAQVATCDTITVKVSGGKKPYTVTAFGFEDPPVLNITLNPGDDTVDIVNRVAPRDGFLLAASDADGRRSYASSIILSTGSQDLSCNGRQSRSYQSGDSSSGGSNAGAIAGGVIGGLVLLLAVVLGFCFFQRRRKRMAKVKHGGVVDLSKDEALPLSEGEAIPYVVSGGGNLRHSQYRPDIKRSAQPSSPKTVAPAMANVAPSSILDVPPHGIPIRNDQTPPAPVASPQQSTESTGFIDRDQQTRPIIRHVDAEDAKGLPPDYRHQ